MSEQISDCVVCGGSFVSGHGGQIHATLFEPGEADGTVVTYQFCTDQCQRDWLRRSES